MAYRHAPYTGTSADYEEQITAANGSPSAVTDANVEYAPTDGTQVAVKRRAPKKILIKGRFTGTDAANANWVCAYWVWDPYTEQWHCSGQFRLVGEDVISETLGQLAVLEHDPNSSHGYVEVVSGVSANQVLEVTVVAQEW
jgi:hypothetical protein